MTMVEILTVVAVIVILLSLLLPAFTRVRSTSQRTVCQGKLHDLGISLAHYETALGVLPAGRDALDQRDHSWATSLLPYLGHADLFTRYSFEHAWNAKSSDVENGRVAETTVPAFLCPASSHADAGATDYAGNYGSSLSGIHKGFGLGRAWDSGVLLAINAPARRNPRTELITSDLISDGLSQTFAIVEDAGRRANQNGQWANGRNCLAHEYSSVNENRLQGIYSDHPGGAHALMADGSVLFLSSATSAYVLGAYSTRANRDSVAGVPLAQR
ncbi:MAG: DUF1559 domain-containing protein [Planctomycetes bacterium]|nr:DUF1559 domain-containing protein [Planctomycetota bacterium]